MIFSRLVPPEVRDAYRWDGTAVLVTGICAGMTGPFLGVIARDQLHASALQISFMTAAPFASYLFTVLWAARIERRGALPYLVGANVMAAAPLLAMAGAVNAWLFVLIVVASTMLAPVATTAYNVVLREIYPDEWRGRLMGLVRSGRVVMVSAAALLTGWLLGRFGYRVVFPAAAVIGVGGALCWLGLRAYSTPAPPNRERVSALEALATLWRDRRFAWYSTGYFIFGFSNIMISPVIPIFQVDVLKITPMWVAILSTASAAMGGAAYYYWGHSVDRRGPFRSLLFGYTVLLVIPVVYAFTRNVPTLLIAAIAGGIAGPGTELSWVNVVMRFGQQRQIARYSALHLTLLGIRGLIAPWVGGALIAVWPGMRPIFWLAFGLQLVGWMVMGSFAYTHARPGSDLGPLTEMVIGEHPGH